MYSARRNPARARKSSRARRCARWSHLSRGAPPWKTGRRSRPKRRRRGPQADTLFREGRARRCSTSGSPRDLREEPLIERAFHLGDEARLLRLDWPALAGVGHEVEQLGLAAVREHDFPVVAQGSELRVAFAPPFPENRALWARSFAFPDREQNFAVD